MCLITKVTCIVNKLLLENLHYAKAEELFLILILLIIIFIYNQHANTKYKSTEYYSKIILWPLPAVGHENRLIKIIT